MNARTVGATLDAVTALIRLGEAVRQAYISVAAFNLLFAPAAHIRVRDDVQ